MNLTTINAMDLKLKSKGLKVLKTKPILPQVVKRTERTLEVSLAPIPTITEKKTMTMTTTSKRISRRSAKKRARVIMTIRLSQVWAIRLESQLVSL